MPTKLIKLDSGYWRYAFDRERFAQWPIGDRLTAADVFHGASPDEMAEAQRAADEVLVPDDPREKEGE